LGYCKSEGKAEQDCKSQVKLGYITGDYTTLPQPLQLLIRCRITSQVVDRVKESIPRASTLLNLKNHPWPKLCPEMPLIKCRQKPWSKWLVVSDIWSWGRMGLG